MNCPKCGAESNDGTIFCRKCATRLSSAHINNCKRCGSPLAKDSIFCDKCGFNNTNDLPRKSEVCSKCGAVLNTDSKFCHKCGNTVDKDMQIAPDLRSDAPVSVPKPKTSLAEGIVFDNTNRSLNDSDSTKAPLQSTAQFGEGMEKTMTIPVIKPSMIAEYRANKHAEQASAIKRAPASVPPQPKSAPVPPATTVSKTRKVYATAGEQEQYNSNRRKEEASVRTQKNVLMFLVVFLIVILIGCSVIIGIILANREDTDYAEPDNTTITTKKEPPEEKESEPDEETPEEEPEEESEEEPSPEPTEEEPSPEQTAPEQETANPPATQEPKQPDVQSPEPPPADTPAQ